LNESDVILLNSSIDELLVESAMTPVAVLRVKKLLAKARGPAHELLVDVRKNRGGISKGWSRDPKDELNGGQVFSSRLQRAAPVAFCIGVRVPRSCPDPCRLRTGVGKGVS
jgi:hypothetical protein